MKRWLVLFFLLFMPAPASAQPYQVQCPIYNTTVLDGISSVRTISACALSTGSLSNLFISVTGEAHCGATSDVMMSIGAIPGPPFNATPTTGASFMGSISSAGILTVTSMVTPGGFNIGVGMNIFDAGSGAAGFIPAIGNTGSQVTISPFGTGGTTGTGGVGTYSLLNNGVAASGFTVANEQMWAAPACGDAQCICGTSTCLSGGGRSISRDPIEMTQCLGGHTYIVTLTGTLNPNDFGANALTYVSLQFLTEYLAFTSQPPSSGSFNNGQIDILSPAPYTPPPTGGIVQ